MVTETKEQIKDRKKQEYGTVVSALEEIKRNPDGKQLLLVIVDKNGTKTPYYNFDSVEQVVMALAIAQSLWVNMLTQGNKQ